MEFQEVKTRPTVSVIQTHEYTQQEFCGYVLRMVAHESLEWKYLDVTHGFSTELTTPHVFPDLFGLWQYIKANGYNPQPGEGAYALYMTMISGGSLLYVKDLRTGAIVKVEEVDVTYL